MINNLWIHRDLCWKISQRDVYSRYKGSLLGIIWPFIQQILTLLAYTIVFGYIFKSKWSDDYSTAPQLAIIIYSGLIIFNFFSEIINRSTSIFIINTNYVKKVVFPLEILPLGIVLSALFNFLIGYSILIFFSSFVIGKLTIYSLFMPIFLLPLILTSLGFSYIISSLSVYFRDVEQVSQFLISIAMFATPIFYPPNAIPESVRWLFGKNTLSYSIEVLRGLIVYGNIPSFHNYIVQLLSGIIIFMAGLFWFYRLKKGFSDVI